MPRGVDSQTKQRHGAIAAFRERALVARAPIGSGAVVEMRAFGPTQADPMAFDADPLEGQPGDPEVLRRARSD